MSSIDITRRHHIREAILFSNFSTLIVITSTDEDALVFHLSPRELGERRVALYKHRGIQLDRELLRQICDSFRLMLAATVGEENEWYTIGLEESEGFGGTRYGIRATN